MVIGIVDGFFTKQLKALGEIDGPRPLGVEFIDLPQLLLVGAKKILL
jgi:hypothetical protein